MILKILIFLFKIPKEHILEMMLEETKLDLFRDMVVKRIINKLKVLLFLNCCFNKLQGMMDFKRSIKLRERKIS